MVGVIHIVTIPLHSYISYLPVRLGNSGLKVSRVILGCMTYGSREWAEWLVEEEEAIKHIKYAYVRPCYQPIISQLILFCCYQIRLRHPDL